MPNISKSKKSPTKFKRFNHNDEFLSRISKTLYYSKRPVTDCLSLPVTEFAAELFTEVKCGRTLERLDVEEASRISRNACVSPCSFVLALLYLERLKDCNPEYLQRVAPSELFLVTLMVASKFLQDDGEEDEVFNAEWAKSGDLTLPQMNCLEMEFLNAINWSVFVHNNDFWERLRKLEKDLSYKEGSRRGWFSYTELNCLIDGLRLMPVIQAFLSVSSVCLAAYVAGVATILGSILIASHLPGTVFVVPRRSRLLPCESPNTDHSEILLLLPPHINNNNNNDNNNNNNTAPTPPPPPPTVVTSSNNSHLECNDLKKPTDQIVVKCPPSWERFSDSTLTSLPDFDSQLKSAGSLKDFEDTARDFSINTEPLESDLLFKSQNEFTTIFNRREILDFGYKFPLQNWKYYVRFISLG